MPHNFRNKAGAVLAVFASLAAASIQAEPNMDMGRKLFNQTAVPACAVCHALDHAGAQGAIGPNLDELRPDASRVEKALRNGIGQMPAFKGLSEEQIGTLAKYVATATGASK
ncbi:c-type cytochrome [Noviherbaspirillum saxi]|nr:cytochrome c [Noviherbaspirillum saxi]